MDLKLPRIVGPGGTTIQVAMVLDCNYIELELIATDSNRPLWTAALKRDDGDFSALDDLITTLQYARKVVKDNETEQIT